MHGRAVHVDRIKTRVESGYGFSALNSDIINCFQRLLSISTCAATARLSHAARARPVSAHGV
jgi:uncharacterized protein (DUF2132 family)